METLNPESTNDVIRELRRQLTGWESARKNDAARFSSGCRALDRMLPGQAFYRGTIVEYLADDGSGAAALALIAAREACRDSQALVVIDRDRSFYPPAAANLCNDLNTIVVRPRTKRDQLWTLNQSLRCQGVGAVLCWPDKLDDRAFRSLQLAAENGGAVGLFVRPPSVRGHPTWSELQLLIEPLPAVSKLRRLRVSVVRCRNGRAGASVDLELDDETGTFHESRSVPLAPPLVTATGTHRTAGA